MQCSVRACVRSIRIDNIVSTRCHGALHARFTSYGSTMPYHIPYCTGTYPYPIARTRLSHSNKNDTYRKNHRIACFSTRTYLLFRILYIKKIGMRKARERKDTNSCESRRGTGGPNPNAIQIKGKNRGGGREDQGINP